MKKIIIITICVIVVGTIIGLILTNRATSLEQTEKSSMTTAYSVSAVQVSMQNVTENISLVGTIAANNDVVVLSETAGRIMKVLAEVGDYKLAGDVLVEVDGELKEAAFKAAKVDSCRPDA